jgi:NAD(P)-dependent dehydrogenase (short-subunit alcohol dehydrogenase family)
VIDMTPEAPPGTRPTSHYPPALSLRGRQAVGVGGTRGLGEAGVHRLVDAGARVLAIGRSEPVSTPAARLIFADVTVPRSAETMAAAVREEGGLDILVHVAGGSSSPSGGHATLSDEDRDTELQLNLLAAVRLDRALTPLLIEKRAGVIVHAGSIQSRMPLYVGIRRSLRPTRRDRRGHRLRGP